MSRIFIITIATGLRVLIAGLLWLAFYKQPTKMKLSKPTFSLQRAVADRLRCHHSGLRQPESPRLMLRNLLMGSRGEEEPGRGPRIVWGRGEPVFTWPCTVPHLTPRTPAGTMPPNRDNRLGLRPALGKIQIMHKSSSAPTS